MSSNGFNSLIKEAIDEQDFLTRVMPAYNTGQAEYGLAADLDVARSLIPAGTAAERDFSYIGEEMPVFIPEKCVACMDCVNECPDTAILAKVNTAEEVEAGLKGLDPEVKAFAGKQFADTPKYAGVRRKAGKAPGMFSIFVDVTKCKGCGECVVVCGDKGALAMKKKETGMVETARKAFDAWTKQVPATAGEFLTKAPGDMMLAERSRLFVGGAGSCMGCGEATSIRMMMAATGFVYGRENIAVVASTGCNSVYSSTYPYNPFLTPWTNSLFENSPTYAMGIRLRWEQMGWNKKRLWVIGGDGAMNDIGFQALSRLLLSGMDIKVLVLDTQVYSNTGGQASTATFTGQNAKMAMHGKDVHGKTEFRKELANICMMHPNTFVAQTTPTNQNHFYKAVLAANEFPGPAVVNVYATCQPEHAVADDASFRQGKLATDCRAFPIFVYDPRKGEKMSERLSLQGNVASKEDWYVEPKSGERYDFVKFARSEGRFTKHFDKQGNPSPELLAANGDRLHNWHLLQELAGIR